MIMSVLRCRSQPPVIIWGRTGKTSGIGGRTEGIVARHMAWRGGGGGGEN